MTELILARRRMVVFLTLCVLLLGLLTVQARSPDRRLIGPFGTAVLTVLGPIQAGMARSAQSASDAWDRYLEIGRLRTDNARLRQQVEELSRAVSLLREDALASRRLEQLLGIRQAAPGRTVAARVIARDPARWFSTVLIDRGASAGVRRNDPVINADGVVGRVIEVTPTAARILLISDSRSAVGATIQRSRDAGVVEGKGGAALQLNYLSREAAVRVGDLVVTSGLGGVFPRGLVIGNVAQIVREEGALLQGAVIQPAAPLDRLEELLVIVGTP
ncbi:MAG TPA: rod shape-determining protein MreC [bacterium]|nr:rod shape-determining protein MreC [bacterium]